VNRKIVTRIAKASRLIFFGVFSLFAVCYSLFAGEKTGASFLKIDPGARPAALGGAFTGIADDVYALHYNPGGLGLLPRRELSATHAQWLLDSQYDFIGYAHPLAAGTVALGATRLTHQRLEGRAADRTRLTGFPAADTAISLGFGRSAGGLLPGGRTHTGMAVKYIENRIASDSAATFAFDLGAVHRFDAKPAGVGLALLNAGPRLKYLEQADPLPLTVSAGASYRFMEPLSLSMELRHEPHEGRSGVGFGTEYEAFSLISLRAGYALPALALRRDSGFGEFGGGFGLRFGRYRMDYSFTPFGVLGNAQRLSLEARF
jgi:hypothetical protein